MDLHICANAISEFCEKLGDLGRNQMNIERLSVVPTLQRKDSA